MDELEIEVFAPCTAQGVTFTTADLDEMVQNFAKTYSRGIQPPVKLGHTDKQILGGQADGQPALGWVTGLRRVDKKLRATLTGVPIVLRELIAKGNYKRVSSEIYPAFHLTNAEKQIQSGARGNVLSAVALLGADIPECKTLADLGVVLARDASRPLMLTQSPIASEALSITLHAKEVIGPKRVVNPKPTAVGPARLNTVPGNGKYPMFKALVDSKLQELRLNHDDPNDRREAVRRVLAENPQSHPGAEGIQAAIEGKTALTEKFSKQWFAELMDQADRLLNALAEDRRKLEASAERKPDPRVMARRQDILRMREYELLSEELRARVDNMDPMQRIITIDAAREHRRDAAAVVFKDDPSGYGTRKRAAFDAELANDLGGAEHIARFYELADEHKLNMNRPSDVYCGIRLVLSEQGATVGNAKNFTQAMCAYLTNERLTFSESNRALAAKAVADARPELTSAGQTKLRYRELIALEEQSAVKRDAADAERDDFVTSELERLGLDDTPANRERINRRADQAIARKAQRQGPEAFGVKYGSVVPFLSAKSGDPYAQAFAEALAEAGLEDSYDARQAVQARVLEKMRKK